LRLLIGTRRGRPAPPGPPCTGSPAGLSSTSSSSSMCSTRCRSSSPHAASAAARRAPPAQLGAQVSLTRIAALECTFGRDKLQASTCDHVLSAVLARLRHAIAPAPLLGAIAAAGVATAADWGMSSWAPRSSTASLLTRFALPSPDANTTLTWT
jgi:hypothetical protein